MTTVVGLDPSLTGTGVAVITYDPLRGTPIASTHVVTGTGRKSDTLRQQDTRIRKMRNTIMDSIPRDTDLVLIEGLALGAKGTGMDRLTYLNWLLVSATLCALPDAHPLRVPPATLKKAVTDRGNADKRDMQATVTRWWPGVPMRDDNAADALALASLGAVHMRVPVPFPVQEHTRLALAKLDLPERPPR